MATNFTLQPIQATTQQSIPNIKTALNHPLLSKYLGLTIAAIQVELQRELLVLFSEMEDADDLSLADKAVVEENIELIASMILYGKYLFQSDINHDYLNKEYYKTQYSQVFAKLKGKLGAEPLKELLGRLMAISIHARYSLFGIVYHANLYCDQAYDYLKAYQRAEEIGHYSAYLYEDENGAYHSELTLTDPITERCTVYHRVPIRIADNDINYKLIGEVLIPQLEQSEDTIYVVWAGTHSKDTTIADMERSAGEATYRAHESQVLHQMLSAINNYAYDYQKPLRIVFTGHSLGGAYAQLSFHTMQRALAHKIAVGADASVARKVKADCFSFIEKMAPDSPNVTLIENISSLSSINPQLIKEMRLDVWNSIGVLEPVAMSSNHLCRLLVDQGISQAANYGIVHGDLLQMAGQGMVLSDIRQNGATVSLLKITSRLSLGVTTKSTSVIGSILAGKMLGHMIFPGLGGLVGAFVGGGVSLGTMVYYSMQAHTQLHFKAESEPSSYQFYFSHHPQDVDYIINELKTKSTLMDGTSALLSAFNLSNETRELELDFRKMIITGNAEGVRKALGKIARFYTGTFYAYTSCHDNQGNTPLHLLALTGNVTLWQVIADFKYKHYKTLHIVDLYAKNADGLIPIEVAANAGHFQLVEALRNCHLEDPNNFCDDKLSTLIEKAKVLSAPKVINPPL